MDGGGETGALMRAHDWASTDFGDPEDWPHPLKTLLGILLAARKPMFVTWGAKHLMLYNDAYAEMMGARHPALGRAFAEIWPESINVFGPLLADSYAGTPIRMDDIGLIVQRHGDPEEAHFALSLTPLRDMAGNVGGLFCVCDEITREVIAYRAQTAEVAWLRALFEQSPSFVAVLRGPEHHYEMANPAFRRLVGGRELIGRSFRDTLPELKDRGIHQVLDQVYRTGEPFTATAVPFALIQTGGKPSEERFLDLVCQPTRDANGRVTGVFIEGFDVTAAQRANNALRESEERLRVTVESATDYAILTTDNDGQITSWSRGAEAAFLWTRDEVLGQSYTRLFIPADQADEQPARELALAMRDGQSSDERWHQRKDGSLVFMNGSVRPLHDASGQQLGFIKMARDETERRRQDDALQRSLLLRSTLIELGDRLRDLDDLDKMAFAAAELCGRALDVSRAGYGLVDPERETVTIERDHWSIAGLGSFTGIWHFDEFGQYFDDLRRGETVAVADTASDARMNARSNAVRAINALSFIHLPIVEHGRFVALFYLDHLAPRAWSTEEIAFARAAADRVWTAIERLRAEQRLRTLNATQELLIEQRTQERDRVLEPLTGPDGGGRSGRRLPRRQPGLGTGPGLLAR